jgi:CRISPR/Cas system CMR-associated protein Cmr5 small subunit
MTDTTKSRPTLSQRRAAHAWSAIRFVSSQPKSVEQLGDLENRCKKLCSRIQSSGLGQALAFSCAQKDGLFPAVVLVEWLKARPNVIGEQIMNDVSSAKAQIEYIGSFIEHAILNCESSDPLRIYTDESMAYLPWLSRFAEGMCKSIENDVQSSDQEN